MFYPFEFSLTIIISPLLLHPCSSNCVSNTRKLQRLCLSLDIHPKCNSCYFYVLSIRRLCCLFYDLKTYSIYKTVTKAAVANCKYLKLTCQSYFGKTYIFKVISGERMVKWACHSAISEWLVNNARKSAGLLVRNV